VSVFRTLGGSWIAVPVCTLITLSLMAPALTLCGCVCLPFKITFPYTCTLCPMFSTDPSVFGLASPCTCRRKTRITQSSALETRRLAFVRGYLNIWAAICYFKAVMRSHFLSREHSKHTKPFATSILEKCI